MENQKFIENAKRQIDNHECIFFDVYDTLISWDFSEPEALFRAVEEEIERRNRSGRAEKLAECRMSAEKSLYQEGIMPKLKQIYERMDLDDGERLACMELELELERTLCTRNELGYALYAYAQSKAKVIVAVSDMYLSAEWIKGVLQYFGFNIKNVFVSCEYGVDKTHGELFREALRGMRVRPENVVHFGDNPLADVVGARLAGIQGIRIPTSIGKLAYLKGGKNTFANDYLLPFVKNRLPGLENPRARIGYEVFGPLIVGFCQWVHFHVESEGYDRVLFCARDMLTTFQIYRNMYPQDEELIRYVYVSLASLETPYKAAMNENQSFEAQEQLKYIREYMTSLGATGSVALVDSGFSGRSQKMLSTILQDCCQIHGLYMRVSKTFRTNVKDPASYAFLYPDHPSTEHYIAAELLETLIAATHGRTLRYEREAFGTIVPVLGPPNPSANLLEELQDGIRQFAQDYQASSLRDKQIAENAVRRAYLNLCFFPQKKDVALMEAICGDNGGYCSIVNRRERQYYLEHSLRFFTDLRRTQWKGGFLFRVLGAPYPLFSWLYIVLGKLYLELSGEAPVLEQLQDQNSKIVLRDDI